jgi:hypothetical protein
VPGNYFFAGNGAPDRDQTYDLLLRRETLYSLSYWCNFALHTSRQGIAVRVQRIALVSRLCLLGQMQGLKEDTNCLVVIGSLHSIMAGNLKKQA